MKWAFIVFLLLRGICFIANCVYVDVWESEILWTRLEENHMPNVAHFSSIVIVNSYSFPLVIGDLFPKIQLQLQFQVKTFKLIIEEMKFHWWIDIVVQGLTGLY